MTPSPPTPDAPPRPARRVAVRLGEAARLSGLSEWAIAGLVDAGYVRAKVVGDRVYVDLEKCHDFGLIFNGPTQDRTTTP